ncbi:cell division protein SepF [Enterococcus asini]|uniref:cell division protein SepF n=1 Tax=Enterococcus asini TaxID=57732 RepID=UPI002891618D|nr:cell division protein SepF [Enterococcus asini]MDT2756443.1 cell division protein SepF [Enterococcus asini]
MNIFSRAADFFGLSETGDLEYEIEAPVVQRVEQPVVQSAPKKKVKISESQQSLSKVTPVQEEKVVSIHQNPRPTQQKKAMPRTKGEPVVKISILEPRNYNEIQSIAKRLLNNEAVLINFHKVEEDQARRIVDFLTGTVYAQDGDITRVGDEIFLCTPKEVAVEGVQALYGEQMAFEV